MNKNTERNHNLHGKYIQTYELLVKLGLIKERTFDRLKMRRATPIQDIT